MIGETATAVGMVATQVAQWERNWTRGSGKVKTDDKQTKKARNEAAVKKQAANSVEKPKLNEGDETTER